MTDSELRRKLELERMLLRMDAGEDFARYLDYINPQYDRQWFHTQIARYCQMLAEGKIRNLMVFLPPQHGKSTIVSEAFPAWILGRKPRMKIVGCSYASPLAEKLSRNIQRQMDSPEYQALFPDTRLNSPRLGRQGRGYLRNVDLFETVGEGASTRLSASAEVLRALRWISRSSMTLSRMRWRRIRRHSGRGCGSGIHRCC